ncbi:Retrovirus-related Pol poly from transposon TNT 1-94, partial [Olea europaea subsp. europaea]
PRNVSETPELSHHSPEPSPPLGHSMVTLSKLSVVKPNPNYALTTITSANIPREPHNIKIALAHPG